MFTTKLQLGTNPPTPPYISNKCWHLVIFVADKVRHLVVVEWGGWGGLRGGGRKAKAVVVRKEKLGALPGYMSEKKNG
jgi:hypothetical protein